MKIKNALDIYKDKNETTLEARTNNKNVKISRVMDSLRMSS